MHQMVKQAFQGGHQPSMFSHSGNGDTYIQINDYGSNNQNVGNITHPVGDTLSAV